MQTKISVARLKAIAWFKENRQHPTWHENRYFELWEAGYEQAMKDTKDKRPKSREINEAARLHGWQIDTAYSRSDSFKAGIDWFKRKFKQNLKSKS